MYNVNDKFRNNTNGTLFIITSTGANVYYTQAIDSNGKFLKGLRNVGAEETASFETYVRRGAFTKL